MIGQRAIAALAAVGVLAGAALPARADDTDPRRKVAVLEYRAGSAALPEIDGKLAALLRKHTSLKVIDPDDARTKYGNQIDGDVVACAGEAVCVAKIGAKLGANEVLLVGISEFGDVILTLQRIDVRHRRIVARIAEALAEGADPGGDELDRYVRRVMPRADFLRFGVLKIVANLDGADVTIGGKARGKTPLAALTVGAPATYDIRLTKAGFAPFKASVDVAPDGVSKVDAVLTRSGDGGGPWYGRWWVAAIAGVVVVGAVAGGIVIATEDPSSVPVGGHVE